MYHIVIDSLFIALASFSWIRILIAPGGIFEIIPGYIERWIPSEYIRYPLIYCEKCMAGQIAFWYGFFAFLPLYDMFYIIFLSMTMAAFLGSGYEKLNR